MIEAVKLKNKIKILSDLQDIVASMKAYANLTISKSKRELPFIREYQNSIEDSIGYMVSYFPNLKESVTFKGLNLYILFGSEEGLCGKFNEKIFNFYRGYQKSDNYLILVGKKLIDEAIDKKIDFLWSLNSATSIEFIEDKVFELVEYISRLNEIKELNIIYTKLLENGETLIKKEKILPPDFKKFERYVKIKEPLLYLDKEYILDELIEEYIMISLYRGFIESLSSENQHRLKTMQSAENHIEKKSKEINEKLNILRQEEITNELLEIVNGYKAIKKED